MFGKNIKKNIQEKIKYLPCNKVLLILGITILFFIIAIFNVNFAIITTYIAITAIILIKRNKEDIIIDSIIIALMPTLFYILYEIKCL
jgi:capsular polysaccharide biosynthesis protein